MITLKMYFPNQGFLCISYQSLLLREDQISPPCLLTQCSPPNPAKNKYKNFQIWVFLECIRAKCKTEILRNALKCHQKCHPFTKQPLGLPAMWGHGPQMMWDTHFYSAVGPIRRVVLLWERAEITSTAHPPKSLHLADGISTPILNV